LILSIHQHRKLLYMIFFFLLYFSKLFDLFSFVISSLGESLEDRGQQWECENYQNYVPNCDENSCEKHRNWSCFTTSLKTVIEIQEISEHKHHQHENSEDCMRKSKRSWVLVWSTLREDCSEQASEEIHCPDNKSKEN